MTTKVYHNTQESNSLLLSSVPVSLLFAVDMSPLNLSLPLKVWGSLHHTAPEKYLAEQVI